MSYLKDIFWIRYLFSLSLYIYTYIYIPSISYSYIFFTKMGRTRRLVPQVGPEPATPEPPTMVLVCLVSSLILGCPSRPLRTYEICQCVSSRPWLGSCQRERHVWDISGCLRHQEGQSKYNWAGHTSVPVHAMKSICEQDGSLYAHINFLSHVHLNSRPPGLSRGRQLQLIYTAGLNSKCRQEVHWIWQPVKERERKAGKVVIIKNHVPVVVTQEDVDEYGSVESAVNGRVEEEKVCNELNAIHLIEFNAIGFDLIEFNSISFNRI